MKKIFLHLRDGAQEFIEFWLKQTLDERINTQAPGIKTLLKMDDYLPPGKKIEPTFLYGNHDNFLGALNPAGTFTPSLAEITNVPGFHAEHGHVCDSFNHDFDPSDGWLLTQIAFLYPQIRDYEDWFTAALAKVSGSFGPRLKRFQYALERCLFQPILKTPVAGNAPYTAPQLMFVMGHSHRPMLKEIRVIATDGDL